jgi:hypothetical protein
MSLAGASGTGNGPQTGTGGLVNAATFQHRRNLAPGSLVSMFGLNLNGATVQFSGVSRAHPLRLFVATELAGAVGVAGFAAATSVTVSVAIRSAPSWSPLPWR